MYISMVSIFICLFQVALLRYKKKKYKITANMYFIMKKVVENEER